MIRRMFFLFPDHRHAERVVEELQRAGVAREKIHAVARPGIPMGDLPRATPEQAADRMHRWEMRVWNGNLVLFFIALAVALAAAVAGSAEWVWAMTAVMLASFVGGLLVTSRLPTAHLDDLHDAVNHGEIVLMVDQPKERVKEIEDLVHHRHPEAVVGGVGWTIEALGI